MSTGGTALGGILGALLGGLLTLVIGPAAWAAYAFQAIVFGATIGAAIGGYIDPPKAQKPTFGGVSTGSAFESSPTYGWDGFHNQYAPDMPVPMIYGTHRVAPQLIAAYIENKADPLANYNSQDSGSAPYGPGSLTFASTTYVGADRIRLVTNETVRGLSVYLKGHPATYTVAGVQGGNEGSSISLGPELNVSNADGGSNAFGINSAGTYQYDDSFTVYVRKVGTTDWVQYCTLIAYDPLGRYTQFSGLEEGQYDIDILYRPATKRYSGWVQTADAATMFSNWVSKVTGERVAGSGSTTYGQAGSGSESDQIVNMLFAIGEGEIDNVQEIEINGTAIDNFPDIQYWISKGTNNQTALPGFSKLQRTYTQRVELSTSWATVTTNEPIEEFTIGFICPGGLFSTNLNTGAMESQNVSISIEYRIEGAASWSSLGSYLISAKSKSAIRRTTRLDRLSLNTYELRFKRVNEVSGLTTVVDAIYLDYVTEIQYVDLSYPNTALLGIKALATDQLSGSLPEITCVVRGLKIRDVDDLTAAKRWSNSPPEIVYDLFMNSRYGLGNRLKLSDISISSFIEAKGYCNTQVYRSFDRAVKETRCELDIVIDGKAKAIEIIQSIMATFRGMLIWTNDGKLSLLIDKPATVSQVFDDTHKEDGGNDNIIAGSFIATYIPTKMLPNVLEVQYVDRTTKYNRETVILEDRASLAAGNPIERQTISLFGITRRSQAVEEGAYFLYQKKYQTILSGWRTALNAINAAIGDVCSVTHSETGWSAKKFRITNISRTEGFEVEISVVEYEDALYGNLSNVIPTPTSLTLHRLDAIPSLVTGLGVSETGVKNPDGTIVPLLEIFWSNPAYNPGKPMFDYANVYISRDGRQTWEFIGASRSGYMATKDLSVAGEYYIVVTSVSKKGVESRVTESPFIITNIKGWLEPPDDVIGFHIAQIGSTLEFKWDAVSDADIAGYEIRRGTSWGGSQVIVKGIKTTSFTLTSLLYGNYTYMIKAVDTSGMYSLNAASITFDSTDDGSRASGAFTYEEGATFTDLDSIFNLSQVGGGSTGISQLPVILDSVTTWESTDTWGSDNSQFLTWASDVPASGQYEVLNVFIPTAVLPSTYPVRVIITPVISTIEFAYPWFLCDFSWVDDASKNLTWEGLDAAADYSIEINYLTGPGTYEGWRSYTPTARKIGYGNYAYFNFRVVINSFDSRHNYLFEALEFYFDYGLITEVEIGTNESIDAAGKTISFIKGYRLAPKVKITVRGSSDINAVISSITLLTFTVKLFDADGVATSGYIDWEATGSGR